MNLFGIGLKGLSGVLCHGDEIFFVSCLGKQPRLLAIANDMGQRNSCGAWHEAQVFFKRFGPLVPFIVFGEWAWFAGCFVARGI